MPELLARAAAETTTAEESTTARWDARQDRLVLALESQPLSHWQLNAPLESIRRGITHAGSPPPTYAQLAKRMRCNRFLLGKFWDHATILLLDSLHSRSDFAPYATTLRNVSAPREIKVQPFLLSTPRPYWQQKRDPTVPERIDEYCSDKPDAWTVAIPKVGLIDSVTASWRFLFVTTQSGAVYMADFAPPRRE